MLNASLCFCSLLAAWRVTMSIVCCVVIGFIAESPVKALWVNEGFVPQPAWGSGVLDALSDALEYVFSPSTTGPIFQIQVSDMPRRNGELRRLEAEATEGAKNPTDIEYQRQCAL